MTTRRTSFVAAALAAVFAACLAPAASAQIATCAALLTDPNSPLVNNPAIAAATSVQATTGGRAYCNVSITYRDRTLAGPGEPQPDGTLFPGYAPGNQPNPPATSNPPPTTPTAPGTPGAYQHVRMGIGLPLNTNTGTAAWSGRFVQTAGGLDQGSVAGFTGYIGATNVPTTGVGGVGGQAAVGLSTDSGHGTADSGSGDAYGYIQNQRPNYGKLKDWAGGRSYCTSMKLAKQLARAYYGAGAYEGREKRTYWEGFSGGGHMGMTQVQNCPEEYDGVLAGAPSYHWQQFRLQDSWTAMVNKKAVQLGIPFTSGQLSSAASAAIAYCMMQGSGGFAGTTNVLHDPRACGWNAAWHVCGHPMAPATNCLQAGTRQAELLNQIFHGPVNDHGKLVYYPYSHGLTPGTGTTVFALSTPQVMRWNHFSSTVNGNNILFADREAVERAGNPAGAVTFADEMLLGTTRMSDFADTNEFRIDAAKNRGMKIMHTHGTHDNLILFRQDPAYYRRVAMHFYGSADYQSLQSWYRLYLVPAQGHASLPVLPNLINWVENGVAPDRLTGLNRLVCPYPSYAQHMPGTPTNDVNNFVCAGNLEESWVARCSMVKTPYKHEDQPLLDYVQMGIDPKGCSPSLAVEIMPARVDLRDPTGEVPVRISSRDGTDLRNWGLADLSMAGAQALSTESLGPNGSRMTVKFSKADLAGLPEGDKVWLTVIGSFNRNGESTRMQATTTVKVVK
jgi:feruloyl esterase